MITDTLSEQLKLTIGQKITITTNSEQADYKITGICTSEGIASENIGRCILTNIADYSGYGALQYKLICNDGADVQTIKENLETGFGGRYRIDYPEGKTEEYINGMASMFNGLMGFGFLALLLSIFFVRVVIRDYIMNLRHNIAVIKVIGGTKAYIMRFVLKLVSVIAVLGIAIGCAAGAFLSSGLLSLLSKMLDSGTQELHVSYNIPLIAGVIIFAFIAMIFSALPLAAQSAKDTILSGFTYLVQTKKDKRKNIIIYGIVIIISLCGTFGVDNDSISMICLLILVLSLIIALSYFIFHICITPLYKMLVNITPLNAFLMKKNLYKERRKTISMIILFAMIIAFSTGIQFTISEIAASIQNVAENLYYGDAAVESDMGISDEFINNLNSKDYVRESKAVYTKYIDIDDINVKVKGVDTESGEGCYALEKDELSELEKNDAVAFSTGLLKKLDMKIGDSIDIVDYNGNTRKFKIAADIKTLEHDGNSMLISNKGFQELYQDYTINTVIIYGNGESNTELVNDLKEDINDPTVVVKSIIESREDYLSSNSSITYLFYLFIIILVFSGMLIMINTVTIILKSNAYSQLLAKMIGVSKRQIILPNIISGALFGFLSGVIGVICGILINYIFTNMMNETQIYNLTINIKPAPLIGFLAVSIIITMISSLAAVLLNYNSSFKEVDRI